MTPPIPINSENLGAVFHACHDDMHGFTVVLDAGEMTYVGRWEHQVDGVIILKGGIRHCDGDEGLSTQDFLEKTAKLGLTATEPHMEIVAEEVSNIRKLGDVTKALRGF